MSSPLQCGESSKAFVLYRVAFPRTLVEECNSDTYLGEITELLSGKFDFSFVNYSSWKGRFLVGSERAWAILD